MSFVLLVHDVGLTLLTGSCRGQDGLDVVLWHHNDTVGITHDRITGPHLYVAEQDGLVDRLRRMDPCRCPECSDNRGDTGKPSSMMRSPSCTPPSITSPPSSRASVPATVRISPQ